MADADTIDFMQKLLVFNPDNRMPVPVALDHRFLAQFHNAEEEIACDQPLTLSLNDNRRYTLQDYRNKIYRDLLTRTNDEPVTPMEKVPTTRG
jgi:mitogen-activated protein kinase 15